MSKVVRPWNPAFDMPHNREQALAVLSSWSGGAATYSDKKAGRIHHLLTKPYKHQQFAPEFVAHREGWVYVVEEGHVGYFKTCKEAQHAAIEAAERNLNELE